MLAPTPSRDAGRQLNSVHNVSLSSDTPHVTPDDPICHVLQDGIPNIVRVLMAKLEADEADALRTEGIFRIPGDDRQVRVDPRHSACCALLRLAARRA